MWSPIDKAYQNLAIGIIREAANDYRNALNGISYDSRSPKNVIKEVEKFFHSSYFEMLTKIKGDYIIERLKREHKEKERIKYESNINPSYPETN